MEWDLEMNLFNFLNFYNCKREHTTGWILKYVLDNFNNGKVREELIIKTERFRNIKNLYKTEEIIMITNWTHKIDP